MKYKIHKLNVKLSKEPEILENFINNLRGEVVSIIPNVTPTLFFYGSKVHSVLIVEKIQ